MKKSAFTLIELLVVIAIIAIIAAILFPVFAKAREKARQTTCVNNMKQIGIAILQYNGDYDENLPPGRYVSGCGGSTYGLPVILGPYIQKVAAYSGNQSAANIWTCPDDTGPRWNATAGTSTDSTGAQLVPQSYAFVMGWSWPTTPGAWTGMSGQFNTNSPSGSGWPLTPWMYDITDQTGCSYDPGVPTSDIPSPSNSLMIVETENPLSWLGANGPGVAGPFNGQGGFASTIQWNLWQNCSGQLSGNPAEGSVSCATTINPVHSGGWNYLYCDGHVKFKEPQNTLAMGTSCNKYGSGGPAANASNGTRPCGDWTIDQ